MAKVSPVMLCCCLSGEKLKPFVVCSAENMCFLNTSKNPIVLGVRGKELDDHDFISKLHDQIKS